MTGFVDFRLIKNIEACFKRPTSLSSFYCLVFKVQFLVCCVGFQVVIREFAVRSFCILSRFVCRVKLVFIDAKTFA
jgi:hypothetical protein